MRRRHTHVRTHTLRSPHLPCHMLICMMTVTVETTKVIQFLYTWVKVMHTSDSWGPSNICTFKQRMTSSEILQCCSSSFLEFSTEHPLPSRLLHVPKDTIAQHPSPSSPQPPLWRSDLLRGINWKALVRQPPCSCYGNMSIHCIWWHTVAQIIREDSYVDVVVVFIIKLEGRQRWRNTKTHSTINAT